MSRYWEFQRAVRRHAPSVLIPYAAMHAASHLVFPLEMNRSWVGGFPPWFYSALAREAILRGSEFRSKPVDERAMRYLRNLFVDSHDLDRDGEMNIARLFSGIAYEQFPYQTSVKEELARPYLLFSDTEVSDRHAFPGPTDWTPVLGGTIEQALSTTFILHVGSARNAGIVDPSWFKADWYARIEAGLPAEVARRVMDGLSATPEVARRDGESVESLPMEYQRYAYNPLVKTPLLDLGDTYRYVPQPHLVLTAMTAENLYYRGMQVWDRHEFGAALGARVEAYVGRQLREAGKLEVLPEFHWHRKRQGRIASSDWFVVTPHATILVECKSARTNPAQRSGSKRGFQATAERLSKAYEQLSANARELRASNPFFKHVPTDRPLIGLVVTAEPFYLANSIEMRRLLPSPEIPVLTASLRELENLAVLPAELFGSVLKALVDSEELYTWSLSRSVESLLPEGYVREENPLIARTFMERVLPILPDADEIAPD